MSGTATAPMIRRLACAIGAAAIGLGIAMSNPGEVRAQSTAGQGVVQPSAPLSIEVRKGRVIRLERPAAAVFVADPDTADVQVHSPSLIYLLGRRAGTTSLYAVDENDQILLRRDIVVEHNLSTLRDSLRDIAPGQPVEVSSVDGGIILAGSVDDPRTAQDVRDTVGRFLGQNETLVNRMTVSAPTQVSLRVRVAEVSREVFKLFGFNLDALWTPGDFAFGLTTGRLNGTTTRFVDANGPANAASGGYSNGNLSIDGVMDALERDGLVTVLAEPNLTALSGETASFLAGGEFPVPVGVDDNEIKIEFKEFGVSLAFTPTVLSRQRISLKVRPEVSELSENGAIRLNNIVIPALSTRRAETTVELGSGQSFAVGGLISSATRNNIEKFPGLGDLPILGTLFRSNNFRQQESELVIVVTPYLVRPVSEPTLALPTDGYRAPSDFERIIQGRLVHAGLPGGRTRLDRDARLVGPAGFAID